MKQTQEEKASEPTAWTVEEIEDRMNDLLINSACENLHLRGFQMAAKVIRETLEKYKAAKARLAELEASK